MSGKHENIRNQADRLDEDDMAQWRRRQELYRAYDGPVAPGMMARAGDGEARLVQLVREAEERAASHEAAARKWRERGKPEMARRCREDAALARDTAALNRDALEKLRADRARAASERGPAPNRTGKGEAA